MCPHNNYKFIHKKQDISYEQLIVANKVKTLSALLLQPVAVASNKRYFH